MPDSAFAAIDRPPGTFVFHAEGGRPLRAEGWLVRTAAPRDAQAQTHVAGHLPGYHAGHLIPACFGGPGDARNLVPMPELMNVSYVKAVENAIGRLLAFGPLYLRVTVEYGGTGPLPSTVLHEFFQRTADGAMRRADGGYVLTNVAHAPGRAMSGAQDQYTGRALAPKDFLDPASRRGLGPHGAH